MFGLGLFSLQAQDYSVSLDKKLSAIGFENVTLQTRNDKVLVSIENHIYSWNVAALSTAIDTLVEYSGDKSDISLYFLKNGIPQVQLNVPVNLWLEYRQGLVPRLILQQAIDVSYTIDENWRYLKDKPALNSTINKVDLVIYPQLSIQNRLLSQLYEIQFNIAPAIEVSLWKGMLFTGQVIFPLKNDFEVLDIKENVYYQDRNFLYQSHEGDYIRLGFVTISQDFRMPRQWFGQFSLGNFNAHRYGVNLDIDHLFGGNKFHVGARSGLTGSSHFYHGQWVTSSLKTFTWQVKTGYFNPQYNIQLDLSYGCYLNKDKGFRVDCIRHFGATTVGFYALYTGEELNGGFKFSIPLIAKQSRKHAFRIAIPSYFDSDYNAKYAVYYGKEFETKPNENQSEHFTNPLFLQNNLLKH